MRSGNESYFINICGKKIGNSDLAVWKRENKSSTSTVNYGSAVPSNKHLPTLPYGSGFSITFNGTKKSKTGCVNPKIRTKINFQCDKILVSFLSHLFF